MADLIKEFDIRGRIGARRPADRALIDVDNLVDVFAAGDSIMFPNETGAWSGLTVFRFLPRDFVICGIIPAAARQDSLAENIIDERALARTAHPGYGDKNSNRNFHIDVFEIVVSGAENLEPFLRDRPALIRNGNLPRTRKILAGHTGGLCHDVRVCAGRDDFPATYSRTGAKIDNEVGRAHRFLVVLDDDDGVAQVP